MRVITFLQFVQGSELQPELGQDQRIAIATYGLIGETGSLLSAIKKQIIDKQDETAPFQSNDEIIEELGDVIWYCFMLFEVMYGSSTPDLLSESIASVHREVTAETEDGEKFRDAIADEDLEAFLKGASKFPGQARQKFSDYQTLAWYTARTKDDRLRRVCVTRLWEHCTSLLARRLPEKEKRFSEGFDLRSTRVVLGQIAWHLAAIASLYELSLDDVVQANMDKIQSRFDETKVTPLHDDDFKPGEQIPRDFEVQFVRVGENHCRMYMNGKRLGDDLTNNSHSEDGYRYHDVMHLANAAFLGWSPVLRSLLKKKRKSKSEIDEVEDGARAQIVEESVVKFIHSEGERIARSQDPEALKSNVQLFQNGSDISFSFLRSISEYVRGLEVHKNFSREWELAIRVGYEVFFQLREHKQGTVKVSLTDRSLTFHPELEVDLDGVVTGIGHAASEADNGNSFDPPEEIARQALLNALGFSIDTPGVTVRVCTSGILDPKIENSHVLKEMWKKRVISARVNFVRLSTIHMGTVLLLSDPTDSKSS